MYTESKLNPTKFAEDLTTTTVYSSSSTSSESSSDYFTESESQPSDVDSETGLKLRLR